MKIQTIVAVVLAGSFVTGALADDVLGKDRRGRGSGGGGGTSGGGNTNPPPQNRERKSEPPPTRTEDRNRDRDRTPPPAERPREVNPGGDRIDNGASRRASRSGRPTYGGTSNNRPVESRSRESSDRADQPRESEATRAARREGRPQPETRFRSGYTHYDSRFNDDRWNYGFYRWDHDDRSACSPWYGYSNLPGYVNRTRVSFSIGSFSFSVDDRYCWDENEDNRDYRRSDAPVWRYADDWSRAFQRRDIGWFDRAIPSRGSVVIRTDNQRAYSLNNDDFYDLVVDCVENTRTREYRVLRVSRGWGGAEIIARHTFEDAWRQRQTVYHRLILEQTNSRRSNLTIIEFGTSRWDPR